MSAHAYLFIGPRGIGKRTLIEHFARSLACLDPQAGTACGNCRSCALAGRPDHPDILRLPEDEKDGNRISIEAVRGLIHRLGHRPTIGRMRVCILPRIDRCSEEAANALLKTLEEPPANTMILMTARHASAIPPTVRSRCAVITLTVGSAQAVKAALIANGVSTAEAVHAADLSGGRGEYGKLLAISPELRERVAENSQVLLTVLESPIHERIRQAELLADRDEQPDELFDHWETVARSLVYASAGQALRGPAFERVRALSERCRLDQAFAVLAAVVDARRRVSVSNNSRLAFENMFLHLPKI